MASIKLKGDTSGEISLTTPATLSNGTITIPDTTGSFVTADGSGNVSTSGNISTPTGTVTASTVSATTVSAGTVTATGNISTPSGTVTASSFSGDGSSLTGIAGGFSNMEVFTSPGTWTNPGNVTKVKVTVVGGGGGGTISTENTANSAPSGGTSSFGAYCSATGGTGGAGSTSRKQITGVGGVGSGGQLNITGGMGLSFSYSAGSPSFAQGGGTFIGQGAEKTGFTNNHGPYSQSATYGGGATVTAFSPGGSAYAWEGGCPGGGGGTAIEIIPFPSGTNVPVTIGSAGNTPVVGPTGAPPPVTTQAGASGVVIVEY